MTGLASATSSWPGSIGPSRASGEGYGPVEPGHDGWNLYRQPDGVTGMRAGMPEEAGLRLRAESKRYRRTA
jgi:hypothetical protein